MAIYDKSALKANLEAYLHSCGIDTKKLFKCINPMHNDSTASMKYFDDNRIYCFGCGQTYDLISAISVMENVDLKEAYKRAIRYYPNSISTTKSVEKQVEPHAIEGKDYSKAYYVWHNKLLDSVNAKEYLTNRGISHHLIDKFNLGYNEFHFQDTIFKGIIIPINEHCFTARNIEDSNFRYYKTKGSHVDLFNKKAIFNENPYCIITEGEFDALSYESLGYNATALGSVSNFSKFIDMEIDKNKTYILSLDNDNAGNQTTEKFISYFKQNNIKYKVFDNLGFKDANCALIENKDKLNDKVERIVKDIENQSEMD